jgi:hypothetical protein
MNAIARATQQRTTARLPLDEDQQRKLWGSQVFYPVYSAVNGGRKLEADQFEGLR